MPEAAWGRSFAPCPSRKSYPHVAMMQSGQDLCGDDGPRSLESAVTAVLGARIMYLETVDSASSEPASSASHATGTHSLAQQRSRQFE